MIFVLLVTAAVLAADVVPQPDANQQSQVSSLAQFEAKIAKYKDALAAGTLTNKCIFQDVWGANSADTTDVFSLCTLDFRACQAAQITQENLNTNMIAEDKLVELCKCRIGFVKCLALIPCEPDNQITIKRVCQGIKESGNLACAKIGVLFTKDSDCTWNESNFPSDAALKDILATQAKRTPQKCYYSKDLRAGYTSAFHNCPWNVPIVSSGVRVQGALLMSLIVAIFALMV